MLFSSHPEQAKRIEKKINSIMDLNMLKGYSQHTESKGSNGVRVGVGQILTLRTPKQKQWPINKQNPEVSVLNHFGNGG